MPAKRALSAALALTLVVSFAAPSGARAASADGFEYTLTGSDATVTGCTSTCPTTLVIPSTLDGYSVTSIGYSAFFNIDLTTVTIPSSVTSIGIMAFEWNSLTSVTFLGNAPTYGTTVFLGNTGLTFVTRPYAATGWGSTWSGVDVVTAAAPTPSPTATPAPTATPTPPPSSTVSPTPAPSITGSPEPSASSDPEPSASADTGGEEPSPTDGDAAPWLIALLLLLASGTVAAVIRRRQRESRRN